MSDRHDDAQPDDSDDHDDHDELDVFDALRRAAARGLIASPIDAALWN